jgi:hypothetical protein
MKMILGITNKITDYLNSIIKEDKRKTFERLHFSTYFMEKPDPLRDFEKEEFPTADVVVCFRSLGYTMGHVYLDKDKNILKFCVYDRSVLDYDLTPQDLEKELNSRYIGKNFDELS